MVLVCHVTLQDHVIKALYDFMIKIKIYHHPNKLGGHRHCGTGDIMVLVCHVILDQKVMWPYR